MRRARVRWRKLAAQPLERRGGTLGLAVGDAGPHVTVHEADVYERLTPLEEDLLTVLGRHTEDRIAELESGDGCRPSVASDLREPVSQYAFDEQRRRRGLQLDGDLEPDFLALGHGTEG